MAGDLVYAFRVMRLPLLDADGVAIGKLEDVVLLPARGREPPEVIGFVATVQRRRLFVNINRVAELDSDGARLRSWDLDVNPFKPKAGEILVGQHLIDQRIGDETVSDVALHPRRAEHQVDGREGASGSAPPVRAPVLVPHRRLGRGAEPVRDDEMAAEAAGCGTCTRATSPPPSERSRSRSAGSWPR